MNPVLVILFMAGRALEHSGMQGGDVSLTTSSAEEIVVGGIVAGDEEKNDG